MISDETFLATPTTGWQRQQISGEATLYRSLYLGTPMRSYSLRIYLSEAPYRWNWTASRWHGAAMISITSGVSRKLNLAKKDAVKALLESIGR